MAFRGRGGGGRGGSRGGGRGGGRGGFRGGRGGGGGGKSPADVARSCLELTCRGHPVRRRWILRRGTTGARDWCALCPVGIAGKFCLLIYLFVGVDDS